MEQNTTTDAQKKAIYVMKVFSIVLKIEEVLGKYDGTMSGHGTLYLSKLLFDPGMVIAHVKSRTDKTAFELFDEALNTVLPSMKNDLLYNFHTHLAGAFSVLPNSGYTQAAIKHMAAQGHPLEGFELEEHNGRLIPKHFSSCISAEHVHDYMATLKSGQTSLICSNRGAVAINVLIDMLQYEKDLEQITAPNCTALRSKASFLARHKMFYDTVRRSRELSSFGTWTMGTPVLTELEWARLTELWMRPIEFHMKIINNMCGATDFYSAHYPAAEFSANGVVLPYEERPVSEMPATRSVGQCYANWNKDGNCAEIHPDGQAGCDSVNTNCSSIVPLS